MQTVWNLGVGALNAIDLVWVVVALRAAWLLPDWVGKWQRLIARRRARA
jgi:hypothetical protein